MVIVEIAGKYLRMVADFDMPLFLIFQSLAVSGVGQEQAHFFTLPANRRVMGKGVKNGSSNRLWLGVLLLRIC